jgi:hypothetical protein
VSCFARKTTSCLISRTKTTFMIIWIVTNDIFRVVSESTCSKYVFKLWQTEQLVLYLNHRVKTMGLRAKSLKKSETTRRKVGQHDQEKLNCHRYITSQFAYHNVSTAGGIIRLLLLHLTHKIAVGKRKAVAFKYRLKSILNCWCQPAPLAIPL